MMHHLDYERREAVYGQDNAKRLKRLAVLFSIVDILVLIKMAYNFFFGAYLDDQLVPIFWTTIFVVAGLILLFLNRKLHNIQKEIKEEIKAIDKARLNARRLERKKQGLDF